MMTHSDHEGYNRDFGLLLSKWLSHTNKEKVN